MQIGDYIKVYDNMLSEKVCSDLIALFNNEQYPIERIDNKLHPLFTQMHVTQVLGEDHKLHRCCATFHGTCKTIHKRMILPKSKC